MAAAINAITTFISLIFTVKFLSVFYHFSLFKFSLYHESTDILLITVVCAKLFIFFTCYAWELCLCVSESVVAGPRPVAAWSEDRTVAMFSPYGC